MGLNYQPQKLLGEQISEARLWNNIWMISRAWLQGHSKYMGGLPVMICQAGKGCLREILQSRSLEVWWTLKPELKSLSALVSRSRIGSLSVLRIYPQVHGSFQLKSIKKHPKREIFASFFATCQGKSALPPFDRYIQFWLPMVTFQEGSG